ncbi:MAG TPA: biopolymer transporter ExbD [Chthoniobacterales bacterium]|jgi:biopolymer transport protein ExbD|nr:biopolymer transporter ExbD [Chthoniobacterales bacterium]
MEFASPIPHKKARIEIIPLIDIMFFLLASFMMVSLSQVHMKGMKVNLPTGKMGVTQTKREYVSLSVDKDGQIYFDKTPMDPNQVYQKLVEVHKNSPQAKIFIRGDRDTYHGDIIRLIEQVRAAGIYRVAFEIKSPSLPTNTSP